MAEKELTLEEKLSFFRRWLLDLQASKSTVGIAASPEAIAATKATIRTIETELKITNQMKRSR